MAVMAAIGGAMMKGASAIAGPAMTKSLAGRGLKSGSMFDKKTSANIKQLTLASKQSLKLIKTISKGVAKFVSFMAKHSPALKQQLLILGKSITLLLRPIGDIMAKFMRPMSLWVMKVAMKWYSMFATKTKSKQDDPEDALKAERKMLKDLEADPDADPALIKERQGNIKTLEAETKGASTDTPWTDAIKDFNEKLSGGLNGLRDFSKETEKIFDASRWGEFNESMAQATSEVWTKMLPDSVKALMESISATAKSFWEVLKDLWKAIEPIVAPLANIVATIVGAALVTAIDLITLAFEGLTLVFTGLSVVLKLIRSGFDILCGWLDTLWSWLEEKIPSAFKSMVDWFDKLIKKITDFVANPLNIFGKEEKMAVGGSVDTTGLYNLHAGERVLTAGDNSRTFSSDATNITNNITIQATINNGMDIQDLANQLAALNETELRRRVSYI